MAEIDEIDRRIVALLHEGARSSFRQVGEAVGLTAPAVKRRVDRLEAEGVIRGYAAVVDAARFGYAAQAFVFLFCEGRMTAEEVRDAVVGHPEVAAAYTIAGEPSALLQVRTRDTKHLEETLQRIRETPGVLRTQTQIVFSTLFERPFGPDSL